MSACRRIRILARVFPKRYKGRGGDVPSCVTSDFHHKEEENKEEENTIRRSTSGDSAVMPYRWIDGPSNVFNGKRVSLVDLYVAIAAFTLSLAVFAVSFLGYIVAAAVQGAAWCPGIGHSSERDGTGETLATVAIACLLAMTGSAMYGKLAYDRIINCVG